jgi:GNAT superfamily N-acetyltransferase
MPIVRRAELHDLPALRDLLAHLSPDTDRLSDHRAATVWADILAADHIATFVCDADGRMAASCTLITAPNLMRGGTPHGFLENVVTHGDVRRQGHGRAVIVAALQEAWARGCERVILVTGRHHTRPYVLDFYQSCGFEGGRAGLVVQRPS